MRRHLASGTPAASITIGAARTGGADAAFQRIPQLPEPVALAVVVGDCNPYPTGPACFWVDTGDGADLVGPEFEIGSEAVKIMKAARKPGSSERAFGAPQCQETGFKPKVVMRLPRNPLLDRQPPNLAWLNSDIIIARQLIAKP